MSEILNARRRRRKKKNAHYIDHNVGQSAQYLRIRIMTECCENVRMHTTLTHSLAHTEPWRLTIFIRLLVAINLSYEGSSDVIIIVTFKTYPLCCHSFSIHKHSLTPQSQRRNNRTQGLGKRYTVEIIGG